MSEWRNIWSNGLPDESRSPKSGHRMAAKGIQFPWWWNGDTISTDLDVIWGMSDESRGPSLTRLAPHLIHYDIISHDDIIGDPRLAAGRVS